MILDKEDRVVAFSVGLPAGDKIWTSTVAEFLSMMKSAQQKLKFSRRCDCRSSYQVLSLGISYGGGQKVWLLYIFCICSSSSFKASWDLKHSQHNQVILDELLANLAVKQVANY